jgi:MFS family permease
MRAIRHGQMRQLRSNPWRSGGVVARRLNVGVTTAVDHGAGFWLVAVAFGMSMALSGAPAPLYTLYEKRDGFAPLMVTVMFAVYALAVVAALVFAGHVSDWLGRKRVLVRAFALEITAALVFLAWPALPGVMLGRLITGLGVGIISATATAHLLELHSAHRPHGGQNRFEVVSSVANVGGIGIGPLITGVLAQFAPWPFRLPWAVFVVILVLCMLAVGLAPETVEIRLERPAYRPQKVRLGQGNAAAYTAAAAGAITAMAIFALFASLAAGFVGETLHHRSRALAGAVVFLVFFAGAFAQVVSGRIPSAIRLYVGLAVEAVGLIVLALAMQFPQLATFLIGAALAVAGGGLLFKAGVGVVAEMAAPSARGETIAGFYLIAYLGLIIPTLGIGVATQYFAASTCVLWYSAILIVVLALVAVFARPADTADNGRRTPRAGVTDRLVDP